MAKCSKCSKDAVFDDPKYCKSHFVSYFERKVLDTIKKYSMVSKKDRVCVGVSGGKDSVSLLYLLKKSGYDVEGLAIDEGIHGYRDMTLGFLREFCNVNKIKLKIASYEDEFGKKLDSVVKKGDPACSICGTFRRFMLNKYSGEYDKIATAHNMDDEAQAVLMNIFKAQTGLFVRQGPVSNDVDGFTQKIKPFYFISEKESLAYSFLMGFGVPFTECPFAQDGFRAHVRDVLNAYEMKHPGTKRNILLRFLKMKKGLAPQKVHEIGKCSSCGFPCASETCKACRIKAAINS